MASIRIPAYSVAIIEIFGSSGVGLRMEDGDEGKKVITNRGWVHLKADGLAEAIQLHCDHNRTSIDLITEKDKKSGRLYGVAIR